jgi:hypothetical protein
MARGARAKKKRIPVDGPRSGSDLCLRCGLCCDGTVFSNIILEPGEEDYVASLGLHPTVAEDKPVAPQPCPAFVDGCCSLYEVGRPKTCHTYACGILDGYLNAAAGIDASLAVIRLVRSLAREMEDEMGLPAGGYNRALVGEYLEHEQPHETPDDHLAFLVAFHRLMALGVKYFGYQPRPVEQAAADAGGSIASEPLDV